MYNTTRLWYNIGGIMNDEDFGGLEPRLAALEQMAQQMQAEKEAAAKQAAIQSLKDQYGMRFGNRDDVALELLNQLNRKGVDVSAASSEAVQDILDDMQGQIAALYDAFNQHRNELNQLQSDAANLAGQLNTIDETVTAATGGDMAGGEVPGSEPPAEPAPEAAPAPVPEATAEPAPETVPAAAPEAPVPEAPAAPAPEAAPAPVPPAEPAPMEVPSDVRVKNISTENPPPKMGNSQAYFIKKSNKVNIAPGPEILSDENMKNVEAPKPSFGKHLISIASRGF